MKKGELIAWQKRFYEKPSFYATIAGMDFSNFYTTQAAAQYEVNWSMKHKPVVHIVPIYIHDEELARTRWGEPEPPSLIQDRAEEHFAETGKWPGVERTKEDETRSLQTGSRKR